MNFFIARQPIFTNNLKVHGYELLYRGPVSSPINTISGDRATASLLSSVFLTEGIDKISNFKPCFINFTKNLILKGVPFTFSPKQIVVEILEDVPPEPEILTVCRTLSKQGYTLALDDFVYDRLMEPFIELADIIKIDVQYSPIDDIHRTLHRLSRHNVKLLAEKVETKQEFETAAKLGFVYHQGYFFAKPEHMEIKELTAVKVNLLQMLAELSRDNWSAGELSRIITRDVSLTYKILRYINSSYFYRLQEIVSVEHAIAFLGEKEIRRFAILAVIAEIATNKPTELVRLAVVRARFCELLAEGTRQRKDSREMFILGLFSTLDAMLDLPMHKVIEQLPLGKKLHDGLTQTDGPYKSYLQFILAYERRQKEQCLRILKQIGPVSGKIHEMYINALDYANNLTNL
ncbi:MAG: HDOD domain-containing protein [Desulfofustis sp.]|nr:HDOD domain-containing protein [Desulfofustis sp.]